MATLKQNIKGEIMNIWNFTGNIGKDCEIKYLKSGEPVCTFSVAVASGFGNNKKTTWANCALFGNLAKSHLIDYLTTGTSVAVSGELFMEEWQGQDGSKNKSLKVNVMKIDLIGSAKQKESEPQQAYNKAVPQHQAQQAPAGFDGFEDEPIPF